LLLAEGLEHLRVEVVGVVVDLELAALLGLGRARNRIAELRHDDRVVAARERDAGAVDRPAGRRIAEDPLAAATSAAVGRDGRRRVLAAGERRSRAGGGGKCPTAAQQRASRQSLLGRL